VNYGRRLILTAGWVSIREFELRRCLHDVAVPLANEGKNWARGFVGLFPPYRC